MRISDWSSDVCSSDLYHLSVDLADKAIALIDAHVADKGDQPFFLNLGFGTAHSPIQVPRDYSAPYDAIYEKGWDRVREERFARMKRMGLIPADTRLPPRAPRDRAWADLSDDAQLGFARYQVGTASGRAKGGQSM